MRQDKRHGPAEAINPSASPSPPSINPGTDEGYRAAAGRYSFPFFALCEALTAFTFIFTPISTYALEARHAISF